MNAVREYRLLPAGLADAQRTTIRRYIAPQLAILLAVVVLSYLLAMRKAGIATIIVFGILTALFLAYISFVSPLRIRRRMTKSWNTYVLTIGPDFLLRHQADAPEIRLPFTAIKRVEHLSGRYIRVIGDEKYQVIAIPESIENLDEIRDTLSRAAPATNLTRDRSLKTTLITACGFAAYMVMLWSESPQIVLPLALVVIALLVWLFVYMQRSPNVSRQSRRISWLYLLFVLICVLKVFAVMRRMNPL
jgi:Na+/H+ antiporter NhaD/arsenite permease-like protein